MTLTQTRPYQEHLARQQRDELVLNHLDLVRHILSRLAVRLPNSVDLENLEAAGMLGLVEAAERFNPDLNTEFRTFAYNRVRGAIVDELRRNCPLPQRVLEHWSLIQACVPEPGGRSAEELATLSGLSIGDVEECLQAIGLTRCSTLGEDILTCRNSNRELESPESLAERKETVGLLADCLEELPRQLRLVLTLYYLEDLKLREIGEVLQLSESRICRLIQTAEETLRRLFQQKVGISRIDTAHPSTLQGPHRM